MAYTGQTTYNRVTGEKITFLQTSEDTGGEALVFDCRVESGKASLPPHVHTSQEERFTLYSGTLGVMLGGKKMVLEPGARITLPAGVKHKWWNAGKGDVHFRVEAVPARNLEAVIEVGARLAEDGKLSRGAAPKNPFIAIDMLRLGEVYMPGIPVWMQRVGMAMAATVGRLFGIDPELTKYRTYEPEAEPLFREIAA